MVEAERIKLADECPTCHIQLREQDQNWLRTWAAEAFRKAGDWASVEPDPNNRKVLSCGHTIWPMVDNTGPAPIVLVTPI